MNVVKVVFALAFLHLIAVPVLMAEENGPQWGHFQVGGSIETGYRWTDIEGKNRYKEVWDLEKGLKLFDLSFWGKSTDKTDPVSYFSLSASGVGDPFPSARFQIKKDNTYDFVATYREYKYFFNREDDTFFSDSHNFDQTTRRGSLALTVNPKDDVRLTFGYSVVDRSGDAWVPRFNITPTSKPNDQDLRERLNEYFVAADFSLGAWDLHLKQAYWNYENKNSITGVGDSANFEKRDEQVDTWVSTIKAHSKVTDRLDLDLGYVFAHANGDSRLTKRSGTPVVDPGKGDLDFDTHVGEIGLSYLIVPKWILHLDYRFHLIDQDGKADTDLFLGAPANARTEYNSTGHTGTAQIEFLPLPNLTLRGGFRVQYRKTEGENFVNDRFNGGKDPANTQSTDYGWVASADWKPYKFLSLFGEYQGANFENPYTWISPQSENIGKVRIKYDTPVPGLSLKGTFLWKRRVNPDQEYRVDAQDYVGTITYQPAFAPGLTFDGSYTYEKIDTSKDIINPTPTPPFAKFIFNSDAHIWAGGVTYEGIYKGLGVRLGGSYAKTLDENPQIFADGTISVWYKNKIVTPILTFERSYLTDQVNRRDGFSANLLTLSLRKDF